MQQNTSQYIDIIKIGQKFIYENSKKEYAGSSIGQLKTLGLTPNDVFVQTGLFFKQNPNVIFINEKGEPVKDFSDLPVFKLNSEDQKKVNEFYRKTLLTQFDKITLRTEIEEFISSDMHEFYLEDEDKTVKNIKFHLTTPGGQLTEEQEIFYKNWSKESTARGFLHNTALQSGKVTPLFAELESIKAKLPSDKYTPEFVKCVRDLKYRILSLDVDFPKEEFVAEMNKINTIFRDKILTLSSELQEKLSEYGIGKFYNGENLAVNNISYNEAENTFYIKAASTDYATIAASANVLSSQGYVRIGVITPFITSDGQLYLFERNDAYKLWSAISGLIQPINGSLEDLVNRTAVAESNEEVFWNANKQPVITGEIFTNHLSCRALHSSEEKPSVQIPTYEFIAPQFLSCTADELDKIIKNSKAPDVKDHTGNYSKIPLNNLNSILENYYSNKPGNFLYQPIILSALAATTPSIIKTDWISANKIPIEELATMLLDSKKYTLTPDTYNLSKIVYRILERGNLEQQKQFLNDELIIAAMNKNDEYAQKISHYINNTQEWAHLMTFNAMLNQQESMSSEVTKEL